MCGGSPDCGSQVGGECRRAWSPLWIAGQRSVDRGEKLARKIAPLCPEGRCAGLDRASNLLKWDAPERMLSRKRLPEEDAHGPHVALGCRLRAGQALGCDVRQGPGHVSGGSQRVRAVELRETEVEQADRDLLPLLEQDVGRLHVTVHDPGSVSMREGV